MIKKLLFIAFILLFSGAASAAEIDPVGGDAWTLYVFGNGAQIWNILNSIKMLVISESYGTLMTTLALLSLLGLTISLAVTGTLQNMPKFLSFAFLAFTVWFTTFEITMDVEVNDPVSGYVDIVTDVPASVGLPSVLISQIGHTFTDLVETAFATVPDNLKMINGGQYNMATTLINDATKFQILNPYIRQSVATYVNDCALPAMAVGSINVSNLLNTDDYWGELETTSRSRMTLYFSDANPSGTVLNCADAYSTLTADIDNHIPELLETSASSWSDAGATAVFAGALESSFTLLSQNNYTGSAHGTARQAAVINSMNGAYEKAAQLSGNDSLLMSINTEQAKASQKANWFSAAELFKTSISYLYTVLQALIFALVPLMMLSLLIPNMGMKIAANFIKIMLWLVMWQPVMAIVNFLIMLFAQDPVTGAIAMGGGDLTASNLAAISEKTANLVAVGGYMMTLAPLITWQLVNGTMSFTEVLGSALGQSFASSAASNTGSESASGNSYSMGSHSIGQRNYMPKTSIGQGTTMVNNGAGIFQSTNDYGGTVSTVNGSAINTVKEKSISQQDAAQAAMQRSVATGLSNQIQNGMSKSLQEQMALSEQIGQQIGNTQNVSSQEAWQKLNQFTEAMSRKQDHALRTSANAEEYIRRSAAITAQVNALSMAALGGLGLAEKGALKQGELDRLLRVGKDGKYEARIDELRGGDPREIERAKRAAEVMNARAQHTTDSLDDFAAAASVSGSKQASWMSQHGDQLLNGLLIASMFIPGGALVGVVGRGMMAAARASGLSKLGAPASNALSKFWQGKGGQFVKDKSSGFAALALSGLNGKGEMSSGSSNTLSNVSTQEDGVSNTDTSQRAYSYGESLTILDQESKSLNELQQIAMGDTYAKQKTEAEQYIESTTAQLQNSYSETVTDIMKRSEGFTVVADSSRSTLRNALGLSGSSINPAASDMTGYNRALALMGSGRSAMQSGLNAGSNAFQEKARTMGSGMDDPANIDPTVMGEAQWGVASGSVDVGNATDSIRAKVVGDISTVGGAAQGFTPWDMQATTSDGAARLVNQFADSMGVDGQRLKDFHEMSAHNLTGQERMEYEQFLRDTRDNGFVDSARLEQFERKYGS